MPEEPTRATGDELREILAEESGAGGTDHPSDDDLLAYREGALGPVLLEGIRDHLVACPECTDRLLDLEALRPEPAADAEVESEIEHAAAWRELQEAWAEEGAGAPGGGPVAGGAPMLRSLAAVLAVAVIGLGLWVAHLRREVDRLEAPQANLPILYLDEPVRAGASGGPVTAVPAADDRILFIVTPPPELEPGDLGAVVTGADGTEVWSGSGLRLSDSGTLRLLLPRRGLSPGPYELRLFASTDGTSQELARYRFTLLPEARGPAP